jgi:hypothetical protein
MSDPQNVFTQGLIAVLGKVQADIESAFNQTEGRSPEIGWLDYGLIVDIGILTELRRACELLQKLVDELVTDYPEIDWTAGAIPQITEELEAQLQQEEASE